MKARVFIGDEEVRKEEVKNYMCICQTVSEIVNEVYDRELKSKAIENQIISTEVA